MDPGKSINCPYFFYRGMCNAYNEENKLKEVFTMDRMKYELWKIWVYWTILGFLFIPAGIRW